MNDFVKDKNILVMLSFLCRSNYNFPKFCHNVGDNDTYFEMSVNISAIPLA